MTSDSTWLLKTSEDSLWFFYWKVPEPHQELTLGWTNSSQRSCLLPLAKSKWKGKCGKATPSTPGVNRFTELNRELPGREKGKEVESAVWKHSLCQSITMADQQSCPAPRWPVNAPTQGPPHNLAVRGVGLLPTNESWTNVLHSLMKLYPREACALTLHFWTRR